MNANRNTVSSMAALATRILAERRAIQARLAALDHGNPARDFAQHGGDNTPTSEPMEVVQESVTKDLELASREVLVSRLAALTRAEERIRDGTYGRCEVCGCPIPPARLRAMPEAVRCVPCAEEKGAHSGTTAGP